jgi:hypothetical protein
MNNPVNSEGEVLNVEEEFRRLGLTPREGQVEAAEALATGLLELATRERAAFIAPPGAGKTLVTLIALRAAKVLPVTWRVRAHALSRHIADECVNVELRPEILLGRERVCPYFEKYKHDVHEWCRASRQRCSLFRSRTCKYYFFDAGADVFVMHYSRARPALTILDIWDEAHNTLAVSETCLSVREVLDALSEVADPDLRRELEELLLEPTPSAIEVEPETRERLYREYLKMLLSSDYATKIGRLYRVVAQQVVYTTEEGLCGARVLLPKRGLLVSATLPMAHQVAAAVLEIPWKRKLRAAVVPYLTSRYEEFDEDMARRARAFLLKLKKAYKRILVFATQRVAKKIAPAADLYEPESIPRDWTGALLLHARGRFSEGVDIRGVDAVVVLGAPYLPPHASDKLKRVMERLGIKNASEIAMLNTTLQCIGRATRSPEDNPLVILADYRFEKYADELSKYFEFIELGM